MAIKFQASEKRFVGLPVDNYRGVFQSCLHRLRCQPAEDSAAASQTVEKFGQNLFGRNQAGVAVRFSEFGGACVVLVPRIYERTPEKGIGEDAVHFFLGAPQRW